MKNKSDLARGVRRIPPVGIGNRNQPQPQPQPQTAITSFLPFSYPPFHYDRSYHQSFNPSCIIIGLFWPILPLPPPCKPPQPIVNVSDIMCLQVATCKLLPYSDRKRRKFDMKRFTHVSPLTCFACVLERSPFGIINARLI